jgi:cobalt-zinc-cadmium efflux system outer membrane protein
VDVAALDLRRLLGLNPDATLTVRESIEVIVLREAGVPLPATDNATLAAQRSDVRGASARVDIAAAKIGRAQGEGRFDVGAFANYMRMDAGFPQRALAPDGTLVPIRGLFHYASVGAMVTLPLLNRSQGEIAAARAERSAASATYEATMLTAQMELAAARVRHDRALKALEVYSGATLSLARQNLEVIRQSHQLGRVTVFEVLAEQRRYLDVERAYTAALREAYEARTALTRAAGGVQ